MIHNGLREIHYQLWKLNQSLHGRWARLSTDLEAESLSRLPPLDTLSRMADIVSSSEKLEEAVKTCLNKHGITDPELVQKVAQGTFKELTREFGD
jgi:hypothetical protein